MSESLRDTIANAYEEVTAKETSQTGVVESTIPGPETTAPSTPVETQTTEKPGRTAGRQRDEKGKLLPGKAEKVETVSTDPAATVPVVPRPPRPSSWKKDYWEHWDKLDPKLAEYINQRESEYAKGVSTYKTEWDQVRPIAEAMAQFQPILQQHNIRPEVWITNLGNAHKLLATGTPEQKASSFLKLAQDYQVPIEQLFVQGQDGKLYFNPNIQPHQQPQTQQHDVRALVRQELLEERTQTEIQNFATATDDKGQLKYPHFEAVRSTMTGLLQANLATDLQDAYQQALALPRHSDITAQIREQEAKAEAERNAAEQARKVAAAKSKAISPKGSTPSAGGETKPKGVRAALEQAYDQVIGTDRV